MSVEKSSFIVFTKYNKENIYLNLKIYENKTESQKEIKFLGIKFDSKLTFTKMFDEIKQRLKKLNQIL